MQKTDSSRSPLNAAGALMISGSNARAVRNQSSLGPDIIFRQEQDGANDSEDLVQIRSREFSRNNQKDSVERREFGGVNNRLFYDDDTNSPEEPSAANNN